MVGSKAIQIMHINQRIRARISANDAMSLNSFVEKVSNLVYTNSCLKVSMFLDVEQTY